MNASRRVRTRDGAACAGLVLMALLASPVSARGIGLKVQVEGLGGALSGLVQSRSLKGTDIRQNVLSVLSIEDARKDKNLTPQRIERLHSRAPDEIRRALEPYGFYRPRIQSDLQRNGNEWTATYDVDPGPALRLSSVDVEIAGPGSREPSLEKARAAFPLKAGEVLYQPAYEEGKSAIEDAAAETGYMDAKYEIAQIRIDLASYSSDVVLHLATGPRYLFGPVRFEQNVLDPRLLRGYVTWKQGEPIRASKLLELQNALSDAPYYSRVEVVPRREEAVGLEVPIDVSLVPAPPQKYQFGAGYGTDTGPRGSIHAEYRRINREGHRAEADIKASGIEKSVATRYLIPGAYPRTDVITFSLGYADLTPATFHSKTSLAGVDRSQTRRGWRESFGLVFQREDFTVGLDKGISNLLTPTAGWTRVIADDRIFTTNGYRVQLLTSAARQGIGSNATFAEAKASGKWIHSLDARDRVITRADIGYLATSEFRILPPRVRFFAGGDQSVRGYAYNRLGELDEGGHVIGGRILTVASAEFDHRFLPKWGAAVFFDAGNAMNHFSSGLKKGAGAGVRWISPIGPVRLDGAYGFDQPARGFRVHVNIGPDL
jgi:translocation and assembly module TamA